ncbi:unnamed protein product, partial [Polarella glacialis]
AAERAAAVAAAGKIESLQKLQAILDSQHRIFTQTWEDMKDQVYSALLHQVPTATRPDTPTSTYSASSTRTPPQDCSRSLSRAVAAAPEFMQRSASSAAAVVDHPVEGNARESTLQMWSHLGSELRVVVQRNRHLEEDNKRLRQ